MEHAMKLKEMKSLMQTKLNEIIKKHEKWLRQEPGGERADLRGTNLTGADLTKADLTGADLTGADLSGNNLHWAKGVRRYE